MKNKFASILITNFNKDKYLSDAVRSCLAQNYKKKEILIFDDKSTDNSLKILKKYKRIKVFINKKKKFATGPLNQINGIKELFKKSKGDVIFLLDSDDCFKKNKIKNIMELFNQDKKLKFIQDIPYSSKDKRIIKLKYKNHFFSIWPSFYPTSTISVRKEFFLKFLNYLEPKKFPNLEIDARLCMFAFLSKSFKIYQKSLTIYNFDYLGITSKYKKFSFNWWRKRGEAFDYMKILMKKMKLKFIPSLDYYVTKVINFFI